MKNKYTGLVTSEQIKEEISKRFNIKTDEINESWHSRNQEIEYSFDIIENDKYNSKRTIQLFTACIEAILNRMLLEDGILVKSIYPKEEHIPGDSFEPMDYGTYKFIGFEFTYDKAE